MSTETTSTAAAAWRPDLSVWEAESLVPEALIMQTSTVAAAVEGDEPATRCAYVSDDTASIVAEGATISEAGPSLSEVVVFTSKLAQLVKLSNEMQRTNQVAMRVSTSMTRAIVKAADKFYLTQAAPTSPAVTPLPGLINVTGIEDGGAVATDLDALVDLFATIESNGGQVSHLVMAPDAWASLRKFKTGTSSNAGLLGAGTQDSVRMLLDVPVLTSPALSSGTGLAIDKSAVISAVGPVRLETSSDAYFSDDSYGIRVTWRIGQNVVHADRIGKFTVTDPDA